MLNNTKVPEPVDRRTESRSEPTHSCGERSRGPSWTSIIALSLATLGLKIGKDQDLFARDSLRDSSALSSAGTMSISSTLIKVEDPVAEKVVRHSLEIIDKLPACKDARDFFTSGQREIIIREYPSRDGKITMGHYRPIFSDTVYLNQVGIRNYLRLAEELNIPKSDQPLFAALFITGVLCHEAGHAIHDRELDLVGEGETGEQQDIPPYFIEDEVLCRIKEWRVDQEIEQICYLLFPNISTELVGHISTNPEDRRFLQRRDIDGLKNHLIDSLEYDQPSVAVEEGANQSWQTRHNPRLAEGIRKFYQTRINQELGIGKPIMFNNIRGLGGLSVDLL